jgi:hypothetical protein
MSSHRCPNRGFSLDEMKMKSPTWTSWKRTNKGTVISDLDEMAVTDGGGDSVEVGLPTEICGCWKDEPSVAAGSSVEDRQQREEQQQEQAATTSVNGGTNRAAMERPIEVGIPVVTTSSRSRWAVLPTNWKRAVMGEEDSWNYDDNHHHRRMVHALVILISLCFVTILGLSIAQSHQSSQQQQQTQQQQQSAATASGAAAAAATTNNNNIFLNSAPGSDSSTGTAGAGISPSGPDGRPTVPTPTAAPTATDTEYGTAYDSEYGTALESEYESSMDTSVARHSAMKTDVSFSHR